MIYIDVPITAEDRVQVPPLQGFVMNRTLGDYFETLLYKIFVSIDEHTTVGEVRLYNHNLHIFSCCQNNGGHFIFYEKRVLCLYCFSVLIVSERIRNRNRISETSCVLVLPAEICAQIGAFR